MRFVALVAFAFLAACVPSLPLDGGEPVARAADGEACTSDDDCASASCRFEVCFVDDCAAGCADGEVCADDNRVARLCEAPAQRGEQCYRYSDLGGDVFTKACVDGLVCAEVSVGLGGSSFCVPPLQRAPGELCLVDDECVSGTCDPEHDHCTVDVGEACSSDDACDERCSPEGVCVHDECPTVIRPCGDGTFCQGGPCGHVCAPPRQLGEVCAVDDICADIFACDEGLLCGDGGVCVSA